MTLTEKWKHDTIYVMKHINNLLVYYCEEAGLGMLCDDGDDNLTPGTCIRARGDG